MNDRKQKFKSIEFLLSETYSKYLIENLVVKTAASLGKGTDYILQMGR